MTGNQYRALTKAGVAAWGEDVFDHEFAPSEEQDVLRSGVLELVPRPYRVLSDNYLHPEGTVFDAVYPVETEAALIAGGHIERVRRDARPVPADVVVDDVVTADLVPAEPPAPSQRRRRTTPKE